MKKILLLALMLLANASWAETIYVSDDLKIMMRSGKGSQYRITRNVPSGSKLELLESDPESGYSSVRTASGVEGWVLTRFLSNTPGAKEKLADTSARLEDLTDAYKALTNSASDSKSTKKSLQAKLGLLQRKFDNLKNAEQAIRKKASRTLQIDNMNQTLKETILKQERDIQDLTQQNSSLKDSSDLSWFIRGAGVLIGGIILGLILPRIRVKKRSSWDTF